MIEERPGGLRGGLSCHLILGEDRSDQLVKGARLLQRLENGQPRFVDAEILAGLQVQHHTFALEFGKAEIGVPEVSKVAHGRKSPSAPGAEKRSGARAAV